MAKRELDLSVLDTLDLDSTAEAVAVASGEPLKVSFTEVYEDPDNPRTEFNETDLEDLTASIVEQGILQPIVVWPKDDRGYKIIFGAQRRRAAERAAKITGVTEIPVVINQSVSASIVGYAQVHENNKRNDLSPRDMARFIRLRVEAGDKQTVIAERLGVPKARISEYLALLDLPDALKAVYDDGRCRSPQVLYTLAAVYKRYPAEVSQWLETAEDITRGSVSRFERQLVENLSQKQEPQNASGNVSAVEGNADQADAASSLQQSSVTVEHSTTSKKTEQSKPDADIASLERRMTEQLGSRTTIQFNPSTKAGTIRIRFASLEILEGLLDHMKIPGEKS